MPLWNLTRAVVLKGSGQTAIYTLRRGQLRQFPFIRFSFNDDVTSSVCMKPNGERNHYDEDAVKN